MVQRLGMGFLPRRAIGTEHNVKAAADAQTVKDRNGRVRRFIADDRLPFDGVMIERVDHIGIEHGGIEPMLCIVAKKRLARLRNKMMSRGRQTTPDEEL